jgi:glyoxylase-like metal-dependent hydrolase (beta-lactamase superfamily II)
MLKLYAMCCGRLEHDRSLFFPDEKPGTRMTIQVPGFLIRHARGNVLFDTGVDCFSRQNPVERFGKRIAEAFQIRSGPRDNVIDQLKSIGLAPGDITHVINSHFHFDHCGCNALVPKATFIVQRAEMGVARAPQSPYNPLDWDHKLDYQLIDGEYDVFSDGTLVLMPTPGHTAGHQSLRVKAGPGMDFVLTADACYTREHLDREIVPPGRAAWNPALMLETFGRLRAMQERQGCRLIFGHDAEQWAKLRLAPDPL